MSGLLLTMGMPMGGYSGSSILRPPPGPLLWVRADLQSLGAVSSWTDQSGNGNNLTQVTGTKQPVNTAGVGPNANLPALVFTSANSQSLGIANALIGTKGFTVALVAKVTSNASAQGICASGTSANGIIFGVDVNGTNDRDFNANGNVAISDTTSVASTSWEAWIFSSDASANLALLVNNAAQTLSTANATLLAPSAAFNVGNNGSAGAFLNGSVFEILVYGSQSASLTSGIASYQSKETRLF